MNSPQALMEKYWGWSEFRPGQKEAISASISGKNTLVLLPTGGGKSLCYQLAALSMGGVCVVVSPLIALMIDSLFLVDRDRYASLFKLKKDDYKGWAKGLKKAGYATDPSYAEKLIRLIESLELWKFDNSKSTPKFKISNAPIHVVQKGDTLFGISKKYSISVAKIKKMNGLTSSEIQIGQRIRLEK